MYPTAISTILFPSANKLALVSCLIFFSVSRWQMGIEVKTRQISQRYGEQEREREREEKKSFRVQSSLKS